MARPSEVIATIAAKLDVPQSLVNNVYRRLGEYEVIDRPAKGRRPENMSPHAIALILVGVMAMANGLRGTLGTATRDAEKALNWKSDTDSFVDMLAACIVQPIPGLSSFGLRFVGDQTFGMIDIKPRPTKGSVKAKFGPAFFAASGEAMATALAPEAGMYQDIVVRGAVIDQLHKLVMG